MYERQEPKEEDWYREAPTGSRSSASAEGWCARPRSRDEPAAQKVPESDSGPSRRVAGSDKWWLGVDDETRRGFSEEMRRWLRGIDASLSQYFPTFEENYDTVDQICRLYTVGEAKSLDPLFFEDNRVLDPEHRKLFGRWFETLKRPPSPAKHWTVPEMERDRQHEARWGSDSWSSRW